MEKMEQKLDNIWNKLAKNCKLQNKTEKNLDTKVEFIFKNDNSGKIILSFKSKSDFQRIVKKINE